jgi:hypothetical protein
VVWLISQLSGEGRKPPLGSHGWISSPERRETADSVEKLLAARVTRPKYRNDGAYGDVK